MKTIIPTDKQTSDEDDVTYMESVHSTVTSAQKPSLPGLNYQSLAKDGHCLYQAVGLYCGEDQSWLRGIVAAHLEHNLEAFREFLTPLLKSGQTMENYLSDVRAGREWADHIEIEVLMRILDRPIFVIGPDHKIRNSKDRDRFSGEFIFVYYDGHNHYDGLLLTEEVGSADIFSQLIKPKDEAQVRLTQLSEDFSHMRLVYGGVAVTATGIGIVMVLTGFGAPVGKVFIDTGLGLVTHVLTADDEDINLKQCALEGGKSALFSVGARGISAAAAGFTKAKKAAKVATGVKKVVQVIDTADDLKKVNKMEKIAKLGMSGAKYVIQKTVKTTGTAVASKGYDIVIEGAQKRWECLACYEEWKEKTQQTMTQETFKKTALEMATSLFIEECVGSAVAAGKYGLASKKGLCDLKLKHAVRKLLSPEAIKNFGEDNIRIISRSVDRATQSALRSGGKVLVTESMKPYQTSNPDKSIPEETSKGLRKKLFRAMALGAYSGACDGITSKQEKIEREKAAEQYSKDMSEAYEKYDKEVNTDEEVKELRALQEKAETLRDKDTEAKVAEDIANKQLKQQLDQLSGSAPNYQSEKTHIEAKIKHNEAIIEMYHDIESQLVEAEREYQNYCKKHPEAEAKFVEIHVEHQKRQEAIDKRLIIAVDSELRLKGRVPKSFSEQDTDLYLGLAYDSDEHSVMDKHRQLKDFAVGPREDSKKDYYYDMESVMASHRHEEYCKRLYMQKMQEEWNKGTRIQNDTKKKFFEAIEKLEKEQRQKLFKIISTFNKHVDNAPKSNAPIDENQTKKVVKKYEQAQEEFKRKVISNRTEFDELESAFREVLSMDRAAEILDELPKDERNLGLGELININNHDESTQNSKMSSKLSEVKSSFFPQPKKQHSTLCRRKRTKDNHSNTETFSAAKTHSTQQYKVNFKESETDSNSLTTRCCGCVIL